MTTILSSWSLSCLLSLLLLCGCDVARCEMVESVLELNDTAALVNISGFVSASRSWSLRLEAQDISREKAIRVSTSSSYASLSYPLLIAVRQGRHISSWTLPFIEAGHAFPEVSRTLCPLLNKPLDDNSTVDIIYIDVSTPSFNNVSFNISATIINQYQLRINNPVNEVVSATSPVSYVFKYPDGVDRVLVKVTSNSNTCSLVSVQEGLCPVDQLLDYPDHRGTFQTMQLLSAINMKRPVHQNFIYIVISVYHHDNCSQTNHDFFDGLVTFNAAANYNPTFISNERLQELSKAVTIEISHTLSNTSALVACIVLVLAFGSLVLCICVFFIIDELCCYKCHATYKFLKKFKKEEGIRDIFAYEEYDGEADGTKRKCIKCTACLKKSCAIILGRQWLDELNILIDVESGNVEETDFSCIRRRNLYCCQCCAVSDDELEEIRAIENTNTTANTADPVTNRAKLYNIFRSVQQWISNVWTAIANTCSLGNRFRSVRDSLLKSDDPHISELTFVDGEEFQNNYNPYWAYLLTIVIFYSLPVYQLMLTYQRYVSLSGNEDFCYYNTLCSHPLWGLSAFNNVWSNVSFLFLGILFIILAIRRRSIYCMYEAVNSYYEKKKKHELKVGVPQYFGIYYASGIALIGEALMSGAYHICPTGNNYQFDTAMMFVLVTLGIYQLFKSRNPDIVPSPHKLLLLLSLLILFIAFGVIYPTLGFYILFFFIYELGVVCASLQLYYRWSALDKEIFTDIKSAIECKECTKLFTCRRFTPSPPHDNIRFIYLVVSNLINFTWSLYLLATRPRDFATSFLALVIFNYLLALLFVLLVKLPAHHYNNCGRKMALFKPFLYLSMSIIFWLAGLFFYRQEVTNWLDSPAVSRNDNKECLLIFYDTHDMWHICSAFGIFFSFLLMMTLEDHVEFKKRTEIRVY